MFSVIWTSKSFEDISNIHHYLSQKISLETANKIIDEIYQAPNSITFVEQFQIDEYRKDCRRINKCSCRERYQTRTGNPGKRKRLSEPVK